MRRLRFRVTFAVSGLLVAVLALLSTAPTLASWPDQEHSVATFTAGTVNPPLNLECTASGLLTRVRFGWSAPATGGAGYTGYTYTVVPLTPGFPTVSGSLGPGVNSYRSPNSFLSVLGSGRFELRAVNSTIGWSSVVVTGTIGITSVLGLGVVTTCTVP